MHAQKVQAYEAHAREMHAHKIETQERHAREMHPIRYTPMKCMLRGDRVSVVSLAGRRLQYRSLTVSTSKRADVVGVTFCVDFQLRSPMSCSPTC